MASTNEVFGQIGAAKIFAGGVSNALGKQTNVNDSKIEDLEQQLAETTDEKERKHDYSHGGTDGNGGAYRPVFY